ncbi:MAG: ABC transporter substrate-binding protein [Chloroflexi bacterium]|nr:ABC transporter substrate-binding protein [Chloroflexota bacterium]MYK60639.1 ABC transporter substrate-binding protein [Chloroflexota bacterium]
MRLKRLSPLAVLLAAASMIALTALAACGGTETVVQTVVVKEEVAVEVPVTVEVEKEVIVQGETVVQTVEVEKQVVVEKEVTPTPDPGALKDVPRNRTLVITHWSDSYRTQHDNVENFNWWLPGNSHARHASEKGLIEFLFYTNLNEGNIIPWLGESFEYNDSLDAVDVKIREGAKWSDGVDFTAHDVKFTIDMVRNNAPDLNRSTHWNDMISEVVVHDDYNLTIQLSRPDPRFFQVQFGFGWENHTPIVPKHVWENEDPLTFNNYDPEKGWPLGTGAYRLALSTPEVQIYDRRDDWWASETGFHDAPMVERIQYIPVANDDIAGQLYINNQLDAGPPLLKGTFEAAKGFNDALRSWNFEGPVWGAPDGCNFVLILNNQKTHFSSVDVRWAINHAINRDEITGLAYEGGVPAVVVPISSYGVKQYLPLMQDILDKYDAGNHSLEKVDERMTTAGYSKDSEGFWTKDGERVEITLEIPSWMRPQGPFLEKQLQEGGFDAVFKQGEPATIGDRLRMGETEVVWVQCGSINEPYDTFKSYHSKNSAPPGENYKGAVQGGRYENPEMDAILDEMEAMLHSPDDPRYVELARGAMELFLRDMPVIHIAEELHVIVHNTHWWTGWPGVEDPYVAPYPPWNGWYHITLNLKPTGN